MKLEQAFCAILIAWLVVTGATVQAKLLPAPGEGTHVIPDPRPPLNPSPSPSPLPPTFGTVISTYVKLCDEFKAMMNWYSALTPAEQEANKPLYTAAMNRLAAAEAQLAETVLTPLKNGNDRPMYAMLDLVRKTDPYRARGLFLGVVDKVAAQVNMDYINDPQNPIKARRARDIVMIRTWIGRN